MNLINYELEFCKNLKNFKEGDYVYYPDLESFYFLRKIHTDHPYISLGYSENSKDKYLTPNISQLLIIPKDILSEEFFESAEIATNVNSLKEAFEKYYFLNIFEGKYYLSSKYLKNIYI